MNETSEIPARGRILVVDDNEIIQRSLQLVMEERGYDVVLAGDIPDALTAVRTQRPDVILLDINFPPDAAAVGGSQRDGFWALEWMRYLDRMKGIPIILISSDDPAAVRPHALAAGAAAYLQKPINHDELAALLADLLARKPAT